ncbi:hypothetical protein AYO21_05077 [Fonsecaea monophora]|uniref:Uncharacterized protein n=1 Tax=Fonsecaea monophora TaxID=254056 RepID=A0A177FC40_9EURO|nr:hypothetical protein AYO21_05077 [Fonsecaea monophora]KAH0837587.1 hypothetical protein FOPE_05099 [Fonsecaea pedrosoi]OAG40779.1 hypothetical protein AYO21_05077 [Fonsecaea monophora]
MPNKKSKPNASKGKGPAQPPGQAKATPSAPSPAIQEPAPYIPLTLPKPDVNDDFWIKNARAKALILSTLVPGSEAWKVAEPVEIASDIWRALEDHFTTKRPNVRAKQGGSGEASGNSAVVGADASASKSEVDLVNGKASSSTSSSSGPIAKKPLENMDKPSIPQLDGTAASGPSTQAPSHAEHTRNSADLANKLEKGKKSSAVIKAQLEEKVMPQNRSDVQGPAQPQVQPELPSQSQSQNQAHAAAKPQPQQAQAQAPAPAPAQAEGQTQRAAPTQPSPPEQGIPRLSTLTPPGRWTAQPVKHDSYLSEHQALVFAQDDPDRKKQIQVAATKVLMQKLPTRDMRLLWAVLYGGEDAPWPGSCSAVIPGVTTLRWQNKSYEMDYETLGWSWNNSNNGKGDDKG